MKYLDLFAGYGGFSLGIQKAYEYLRDNQGQETDKKDLSRQGNIPSIEHNARWAESPCCIGFSEIDKYAIQTYQKHFTTHKHYGDITKLDPSTLPDFDLLCGGFPCQAFSIAGKRAGFEDTRGTLIYDVFRIIKEKHPRLVLLENVKGLLSHDNGRTFKTIITSLAELGYAVEWQVLNAKDFGVPQNRERVFIIGHLGGFGGRAVFPIGGEDKICAEPDENQKAICQTLKRRYPDDWNGNHIVTKAVLTPDRLIKRQNGRRMKEDGEPMFTLNTQDKHGVMIEDILERKRDILGRKRPIKYAKNLKNSMRIRRLTPVECERLMGLPDGWTEGVSDTQRYKLCGNGVVVNVVEEIIKRLYGKTILGK